MGNVTVRIVHFEPCKTVSYLLAFYIYRTVLLHTTCKPSGKQDQHEKHGFYTLLKYREKLTFLFHSH